MTTIARRHDTMPAQGSKRPGHAGASLERTRIPPIRARSSSVPLEDEWILVTLDHGIFVAPVRTWIHVRMSKLMHEPLLRSSGYPPTFRLVVGPATESDLDC